MTRRFTDEQLDTPMAVPTAVTYSGLARSTVYDWIEKGFLKPTGQLRKQRVTLRQVFAASAAALRAKGM